MGWIKRNLFFVVGAVVAVALLGFAGYFNYRGWRHKTEEGEKLDAQYAELKRLNLQNPHPGFGKVDNVKLAREQQREAQAMLARMTGLFRAPAPIPPGANLTSGEFTAALRETIAQLKRDAERASVLLPPDFRFSFSQQFRLLNFAPGSLEPLATQLGEVRAICDVLIKAKINHLDGLQRERVSLDDLGGSVTDYVELRSQTNELAVLTPYQITFRSFSPEIAQVLAGFANSPHGIVVQSINVEPSPATGAEMPPGYAPGAPAYYPPPAAPVYRPTPRGYVDEAALERAERLADIRAGRLPPPAYTPSPAYGTPGAARATGPQTVLSEKQLRVTMQLQLVKLLPRR